MNDSSSACIKIINVYIFACLQHEGLTGIVIYTMQATMYVLIYAFGKVANQLNSLMPRQLAMYNIRISMRACMQVAL